MLTNRVYQIGAQSVSMDYEKAKLQLKEISDVLREKYGGGKPEFAVKSLEVHGWMFDFNGSTINVYISMFSKNNPVTVSIKYKDKNIEQQAKAESNEYYEAKKRKGL